MNADYTDQTDLHGFYFIAIIQILITILWKYNATNNPGA